jgi:hypothetical protein
VVGSPLDRVASERWKSFAMGTDRQLERRAVNEIASSNDRAVNEIASSNDRAVNEIDSRERRLVNGDLSPPNSEK